MPHIGHCPPKASLAACLNIHSHVSVNNLLKTSWPNPTMADGESMFDVDTRDLQTMVVAHADVLHLQFYAGAMAAQVWSGPLGLSKEGRWSWLSPSGLEEVEVQELSVPRRAIPHLVGKGGSTVHLIEELTSTIVGVENTDEGKAVVTPFGPALRVTAVWLVIQHLARGPGSLLCRLRECWSFF